MHDVGAFFSEHARGISINIPNPEAMCNFPPLVLVGISDPDDLHPR
jgi:hypothetical protein